MSISPSAGAVGLAVTVTGGGFATGETVKAVYKTGLTSPASVMICSGVAQADGTFTCSGKIPTSNQGALGTHKIVAKGHTSKLKAITTFTLQPRTLIGVSVSPTNATIAQDQNQPYDATGHYNDGSSADVTGSVNWSSTNTGVASMSGNVATGANAGSTTIVATSPQGPQDGTNLTVVCRTHSNGAGQTYQDCQPLATPGNQSTYTETMAIEAATAWAPTGSISQGLCGSGANTYQVIENATPTRSAVWAYTSAISGHVFVSSNTTALCPIATDPTWN